MHVPVLHKVDIMDQRQHFTRSYFSKKWVAPTWHPF